MPMPCLPDEAPEYCFAIDGELSIYTVAELKAGLEAIRASSSSVEIDLSGVTDVDTAGIQWMLMAERIDGLAVRFTHTAGTVLDLLEWTSLAHGANDALGFDASGDGQGVGGAT